MSQEKEKALNGVAPLPDIPAPDKAKTKTYAIACAILASMTSILLGYGELMKFSSFYIWILFSVN